MICKNEQNDDDKNKLRRKKELESDIKRIKTCKREKERDSKSEK